MFEGLDWRKAFKRAAIFTVVWLGLVYALNTISPNLFALGNQGLTTLAFNAVLFFFLYAAFFAFIERRRVRVQGQQTSAKKGSAKNNATSEGEEPPEGSLRGRPNPNTSSRKKSRRRRR